MTVKIRTGAYLFNSLVLLHEKKREHNIKNLGKTVKLTITQSAQGRRNEWAVGHSGRLLGGPRA